MKILIVQNIVSPHVIPYYEGISQYEGMNVTVWFLAERSTTRLWKTDFSASFKWEVLPGISFELQRQEKEQYIFNPSVLWRFPKEKFDVVIIRGWDNPTNWLITVLCNLLKIPYILWSGSVPGSGLFGVSQAQNPTGRRRLIRPLVKYHVAHASAYIAYGTRSKKYLIQLGTEPEKIFFGWNTVDVEGLMKTTDSIKPEREFIRKSIGIAPEQILFLYVGRLQPVKRLDMIIEAIRQLSDPNVVLGIVGYGPCEAQLKELAANVSFDNIRFYGFIELDNIQRYYVAADVFVLPSRDIWGLVVNEAMACGLPVIAADTVGCVDDLIVDGQNGFVYPASDIRTLVEKMQWLSADAGMRRKMGEFSKKHILNYTIVNANSQTIEAIKMAFRSKHS